MNNLKKVVGMADFSVTVECPECNVSFDATHNDDDYLVTDAMFKNTSDSCTDMQIYLICPNCDEELILDSLEY